MSEVLALKHRPSTFDAVVGQDSIVRQLTSALENGTLGHALAFCGTRGTGKTTTARLIAKALNPQLADGELPLVVSEIDAASNTGVDDVRQIIESTRYAVRGHRVVILDEAHMLSKAAFNALLKTLEEPPSQTTFILITTEPHKIPATVRSRCQLYEFRDVDLETLTAHYRAVAEKEGLTLDDKQLEGIALKAEGSVRDGLSLLQKFLSGEEVQNNSDTYFKLVGMIYSGDTVGALDILVELKKNEEPRTIIQTLEKWFYWLSLEVFGLKTPIRQFTNQEFARALDLVVLQNLFSTCLSIERDFTATPNSKVVLDMGVIRLTQGF